MERMIKKGKSVILIIVDYKKLLFVAFFHQELFTRYQLSIKSFCQTTYKSGLRVNNLIAPNHGQIYLKKLKIMIKILFLNSSLHFYF